MSTAYWGTPDVDLGADAVLHPGDIVSGLVNLKNQVVDGRIDPEEFVAVLQERDGQLSDLFHHLGNELKLPTASPVYREALQRATAETRRWLDNVLVLLRAGLGEMAVYPQDWDASHLEQGLVLAAKGERELIDIEVVLADAQRHPMSLVAAHGGLVAELMAARFDGRLQANGLASALDDFERETRERMQSALAHIEQMKQLLLAATRPSDPAVQKAVRRLKLAEMDVSRVYEALRHDTSPGR